jgi:LCP family protein required for cell wall assembly
MPDFDPYWKHPGSETTPNINRLPDPSDERITFKKPSRWKKRFLFLSVFCFLALVALSYKTIWLSESDFSVTDQSINILRKIKYLLTSEEKRVAGEDKGRVNILFLGMGGAGHEGPYLTDTMFVASYDMNHDRLSIFSLPRDLAVFIPKVGFRKINSINAYAESEKEGYGGDLSRIIVSELLGWDIPYYVRVDFTAFRQLVDDIGSITINVQRSFTDSSYPTENYGYQVVSFSAGEQRMDGETALKFVRSRHGCCGEGGDLARIKRQQLFLETLKNAIIEKKLYTDPRQLIRMYQNYQENVDSNLTIGQILKIADWIQDIQNENIRTFVPEVSVNGPLENVIGEEGAFLLQPLSGDYSIIKKLASDFLASDGKTNAATENAIESSRKPRLMVLNGTNINGLAAKVSENLKAQGYEVTKIGNATIKGYEQNTLYDNSSGKFKMEIQSLVQALSAVNALEIPDWLKNSLNEDPDGNILSNTAEVIIILGQNEG